MQFSNNTKSHIKHFVGYMGACKLNLSNTSQRTQRRLLSKLYINIKDAYKVLGVQNDASDAEVKKAYRRLMSQHHPDKLVSKGLPDEMIRIATDRTHEIRKAYENIRSNRGL